MNQAPIENDNNKEKPSLKRIAFILPEPYRGGTLIGLENIILNLQHTAKQQAYNIEFVFYCLAESYNTEHDFNTLKANGVKIREFTFSSCNATDAKIIMHFSRSTQKMPPDHSEFYTIQDHHRNATDCDFWLLISDRFQKPLLPLRPYGILVYDYIQRYVPGLFGSYSETNYLATTRNANFIVTTTPHTASDVNNYAGIPENKIIQIGMQFEPSLHTDTPPSFEILSHLNKKESYFLWTTNLSEHKNLLLALDAVNDYYSHGGKIKIIMIGINTEKLASQKKPDAAPQIELLYKKIQKNLFLQENISFLGYVSRNDYLALVKKAQFLFHPALIDNGTFSVLDAAFFGVPTISADYPGMRYIDDEFKLNLHFFNPHEKQEITDALKFASEEKEKMFAQLPKLDSLLKRTRELSSQTSILWKKISELL